MIESPRSSSRPRAIASLLSLLGAALAGSACADADLTELAIEDLMEVRVYSASKFYQKASDAPSAVSVITATEFRQYGWRTVGEMLRSLRGFSVTYDRQYDYIGVRGFARSGDYNSRLLVLIDGYKVNDDIYDAGYVGTELPLDVDLIDRVEVVRGPSAAMYGSNALFGVVNIVTRGRDIEGGEAAAAAGSYRSGQGRLTFGRRFDNGAHLLLSTTLATSRGPDLSFDDLDPGTELSAGRGTDFNRRGQFFGKFMLGGLSVTASAGERRKGISTGGFGVVLDDRRNSVTDVSGFLSVEHQTAITPEHAFTARLSYSRYDYLGNYVYPTVDPAVTVLNVDTGHGAWWNGELKLVSQLGLRHKLVSGVELQQDVQQRQHTYDQDPFFLMQDDNRNGRRLGIYAQDEYRWSEALSFTFGGRFDKYSKQKGEFNPRFAAVYRASPQTVYKLMYGAAFRAANAYERFYSFPGFMVPGGDLRPEKIRTLEGVVEHYFAPKTRGLAAVYSFRMKDLVDLRPSPEDPALLQFQQTGGVRSVGAELEIEHQWGNGARLRSSLSLQRGRDDAGAQVLGSPQRMFKLNLSAPVPGLPVHAGFELQAMSARKALSLDPDTGLERIRPVPGFALANLAFTTPAVQRGWDVSLGIYNLFDRGYRDPIGFDNGTPFRDSLRQDGRNYRLKAVLHF